MSSSDSEDEDADNERTENVATRARCLETRSRRRVRRFLQVTFGEGDGMTPLERCAVKGASARRYQKELDEFLAFTERRGIGLAGDAAVDAALVSWFSALWLGGHQAYRGEWCLAALLHKMPEFGRGGPRSVARAWRALKGWRKLTPSRSRRPHPLKAWAATAVMLCLRGHPQMALYTLLLVSAYLRPSEGMALRRADFLPPTVGATGTWSILIAPSEIGATTKTGDSDDSILLDSRWLEWASPAWRLLCEGVPGSCVWSFTYPAYLKEFKLIRDRLKIPDLVPYAARHSGPSVDRALGVRSQEEVRKRGRWKQHRSMTRYEKAARLAATARSYTPSISAFMDVCEAQLADVVLGLRTDRLPLPP